ncbi:hypothetical protein [Variovorax sp. ZT4R33]|uniref:hypothetical protein n=1 Tax=Variovorax sp. ZT4R33 TaxID=3443743 RepID=UPI003F44C929
MTSFRLPFAVARTVATATLALGTFVSAQAAANPPIHMADGVEYMCGGSDKAEAQFLQMVSPRWAATLEFALGNGSRGSLPSDIQVLVRDKYNGRLVMETTATGPLMLTRLEPGSYEVEATLGGITLSQQVNVFNGVPVKARFVWPSNIDVPPLAGSTIVTQDASAPGR